jgi:hypothetical protein
MFSGRLLAKVGSALVFYHDPSPPFESRVPRAWTDSRIFQSQTFLDGKSYPCMTTMATGATRCCAWTGEAISLMWGRLMILQKMIFSLLPALEASGVISGKGRCHGAGAVLEPLQWGEGWQGVLLSWSCNISYCYAAISYLQVHGRLPEPITSDEMQLCAMSRNRQPTTLQ